MNPTPERCGVWGMVDFHAGSTAFWLLGSHCCWVLEKGGCDFKYMASLQPWADSSSVNASMPTSTASQLWAEKEQSCVSFSPGTSHPTPNAAFATGLLPQVCSQFQWYRNLTACSVPTSNLTEPSPSQQILTEQQWISWHRLGCKHEKIRFIQIPTSLGTGA